MIPPRGWFRLIPFTAAGMVLLYAGGIALTINEGVLALAAYTASTIAFVCGLTFARSRDF